MQTEPDRVQVLQVSEIGRLGFEGTPLAVFGWPVRHSISPQMHNAALAEMARSEPRFASWRYHRVEVPPGALPAALAACSARGFAGLNLTLPHKVDALAHIADVDPVARQMGAVNTLKLVDGRYHGFNTDGEGFERAVREELGAELAGRAVVLLGAGGAARAIAVRCLLSGCASLHIGNRGRERLDALVELLRPIAAGRPLRGFELGGSAMELPRDALLVNATSLGLKDCDAPPIPLDRFGPGAAVYDTTYGTHESRLLAEARARGMRCANGLSMLVWQGARALEIWTGAAVPATTMRKGAEAALLLRDA